MATFIVMNTGPVGEVHRIAINVDRIETVDRSPVAPSDKALIHTGCRVITVHHSFDEVLDFIDKAYNPEREGVQQ